MTAFSNVTSEEVREVTLNDMRSVTAPQGVQLARFAGEVQKIFPACSFGVAGLLDAILWGDHKELSVYVYHKHKSVVMGEIGVRAYDDGVKEDTFVVSSRKISNIKYSEFSVGRNTVMSKNIDTAVRNAKKYLVELSSVELAVAAAHAVRRHWEASGLALKVERKQAHDAVIHHDEGKGGVWTNTLYAELQVIVNSGHTFMNPEFGAAVDKLLSTTAEYAELERSRSPRVSMVCVEASPRLGCSLFVVARTEEMDSWRAHWEPGGTFTEDTLDPDIAGKLSVLSMCAVGQWVDGVGVKQTTTIFYVVH
jgi:hypothetical protein